MKIFSGTKKPQLLKVLSNYQFKSIPKSLGIRIQELIQSLKVVKDSLEAVKQGKLHQLIPVYGQLRALLSEKRKGNQPLLIGIAKEIKYNLNFFCMSDVDDFPEEFKKGLVMHLAGFPITIEKELKNQKMISFEQFLDYKILFYKNRYYQPKEIIAFFANKAGGAHYSLDLPEDFSQLLSFGLSGQPVLVNALVQIADLTLQLGLKLLKSLSDFEIHISLFIPDQKITEPSFIFDNSYPQSPMRVFCRIDPNMKFSFGVIDINGYSAINTCAKLIDWSNPHHFILSSLLDNFSTQLTIYIDGEEVSKLLVPELLFVSNNPIQYKSYHNRSEEKEDSGLNFGLIELAMYGRGLILKEQAQLSIYFENKLSQKNFECVFYEKGNYGYAPPGINDIKFTGQIKKCSIEEIKKNYSK